MNWLRDAIESYKEKVSLGLELNNGIIEKAIEYANSVSTVGLKAKKQALIEMGV